MSTPANPTATKKPNNGPPPSLLVIIVDTNPYAWSLLSETLPLSGLIANLLVFINAHMAMNYANEVAVLASHSDSVHWLYPSPGASNRSGSGETNTGDRKSNHSSAEEPQSISSKYQSFAAVERTLVQNLQDLVNCTRAESIKSKTTTHIGGAVSAALAYISKQIIMYSPMSSDPFGLDGPATTVSSALPIAGADAMDGVATVPLTSRILIVSVSGDLASQYVPVMNSIFAAQKLQVPIDVLKLFGDTVFLQQASDSTGGVYISPSTSSAANGSSGSESPGSGNGSNGPESGAKMTAARMQGLLQYLMLGFLPDSTVRPSLVMPGSSEVDFRAACFCHRKVVDVGTVCSVCLSIFCAPPEAGECPTCGSKLIIPSKLYATPAVVPRKKKKKKKNPVGGAGATLAATADGA